MLQTHTERAFADAMSAVPIGSDNLGAWDAWLDNVADTAEDYIDEWEACAQTYATYWVLKPLRGIMRHQADIEIARAEQAVMYAHYTAENCLTGEPCGDFLAWMQ